MASKDVVLMSIFVLRINSQGSIQVSWIPSQQLKLGLFHPFIIIIIIIPIIIIPIIYKLLIVLDFYAKQVPSGTNFLL